MANCSNVVWRLLTCLADNHQFTTAIYYYFDKVSHFLYQMLLPLLFLAKTDRFNQSVNKLTSAKFSWSVSVNISMSDRSLVMLLFFLYDWLLVAISLYFRRKLKSHWTGKLVIFGNKITITNMNRGAVSRCIAPLRSTNHRVGYLLWNQSGYRIYVTWCELSWSAMWEVGRDFHITRWSITSLREEMMKL